MELKIFTVDAFAEKSFGGNPAAVVPLNQAISEETLQKVAAEMNLSETAYVSLVGGDEEEKWNDNVRFTLRWFTPTNEVALCGHATLATAHVIFYHLGNKNDHIEFETQSGILMARRSGRNIVLDFPSNPPEELHPTLQVDLSGLVKGIVKDEDVQEVRISHSTKKLLVRLKDSCTRNYLENLCPDTRLLMSLHDGTVVKGVIITLKGQLSSNKDEESESETSDVKHKKYHFVSRYFAPWNGIPEDPVTGSAHTVLGPYWSKQIGYSTLKCRQCSPRGGDLEIIVRDDGRVDISGRATTVIQGHLTI